jgi:CTP:molybdopterin cytidylyltransferase MocA
MAAGGPDDPLCSQFGHSSRGLIPLAGTPLAARTVAGLSAARTVGTVVLTHRPADREAFEGVGFAGGSPALVPVADTKSHAASMRQGLGALSAPEYVLVLPCDMPLLTGESIDDFVEQAIAFGADLCYAVVRYERCRERFPGTTRTAVHLRGGEFTGGNLSLVRPRFLLEHGDRIDAAFDARKNPLRMVRWLGLRCALGVLLGWCGPHDIARAAARALGCTTAVVVSEHPEIAFDVDKPEDFAEAERVLEMTHRAG